MEKSSLSGLPLEVLHMVIERLDGPTRAALARTCHSLNTMTTPQLYRSADIRKGKSNEFMRTISEKFAALVYHVSVVVDDSRTSPCRIVPCLDKLKNLQSLTLKGGYWMWHLDSKGTKGLSDEKWYTLEELLWDFFERASLKQPAKSRVSKTLRSLTLDRRENNAQAAFLHYSHVFIMPHLHDLTLRSFMQEETEGEVDPEFKGQTELKSLRIERSFVSFPALQKILRTPRALRYLSVGHADDFSMHELKIAGPNNATLDDFVNALSMHRESLEEIRVVIEAVYSRCRSVRAAPINDPSFRACAKHLPALKSWEGCDKSSLTIFLGAYSDSSSEYLAD